jgi:hypothetical protein
LRGWTMRKEVRRPSGIVGDGVADRTIRKEVSHRAFPFECGVRPPLNCQNTPGSELERLSSVYGKGQGRDVQLAPVQALG